MTSPFKPDGYQSVSPYLCVRNAVATIEFLKQVFSATEIRRFPNDTGGIMHAEVRIDDTVIMFADQIENWPASTSHLHVYVENVDATYTRALEAGATAVQPPEKKADPDKRGGVRDADGNTWWIATKVE